MKSNPISPYGISFNRQMIFGNQLVRPGIWTFCIKTSRKEGLFLNPLNFRNRFEKKLLSCQAEKKQYQVSCNHYPAE